MARRLLGRLLRDAQPELMDTLIQASKDGDTGTLQSLCGKQTWTMNPEADVEFEDGELEEVHNISLLLFFHFSVKTTKVFLSSSCCSKTVTLKRYTGMQACDGYLEVADRWFVGLVDKDSSITNEVYSLHSVDFDRQV